jgi:hypothetical protein
MKRSPGLSPLFRGEHAYVPGRCQEEPHVLPRLHDSTYDRS